MSEAQQLPMPIPNPDVVASPSPSPRPRPVLDPVMLNHACDAMTHPMAMACPFHGMGMAWTWSNHDHAQMVCL